MGLFIVGVLPVFILVMVCIILERRTWKKIDARNGILTGKDAYHFQKMANETFKRSEERKARND